LADEAHEQGMNRKIVPFAIERRGQYQEPSCTDTALDEERTPIFEANQHRIARQRLDRDITKEAHAPPALIVTQRRMTLLDGGNARAGLTAHVPGSSCGARVIAERHPLALIGARPQRDEHGAAAF